MGWYPTAEGMRPSRAETSLPACEKRKMLSMNNSVSDPVVESRKYSASVSALSATRRRAPGGSFICPNTNAVLSISFSPVWAISIACISSQMSLPSRVRSPTPAKTLYPPWRVATRVISSWMITVLPSPAPPNRPVLPPRTNGASRSMTLMPVTKISLLGTSESNGGGAAWIERYSSASTGPRLSIGSPSRLNTRPSTLGPTGMRTG